MDPLFQDERISAYIDGQLPADERSQFEDELARNSELRQVVDELRGLQESLRALPQRRLDADFAQHVLRRAERAMLSDSQVIRDGEKIAGDASGTDGSHVVVAGAGNLVSDRVKSRRPWIWAAVAIAAAVALMIFNPPKKHDQVALDDSSHQSDDSKRDRFGPQQEEQISATGADKAKDLRNRSEGLLAKRVPESGPAPNANFGGRRAAEKDAASVAKSAIEPRGASLADSVAGVSPPAGDKQTAQGDVQFRQANGAPSGPAPSRTTEGAPGGSVQLGAPGGSVQLFAGTVDRSLDKKGAMKDARKLAESARGIGNGVAENRGLWPKGQSLAFGMGGRLNERQRPGEMIVAEYETPTKMSAERLRRLLEKQDITLNESPAANLTLLSAVRSASGDGGASNGPAAPLAKMDGVGGAASPAGKPSKPQFSVPKLAAEVPAPAAEPQDADVDHSPQTPGADNGAIEVVYVVGSRKQVMGLVDELRAQPAQYRTVAVTAVPSRGADEPEQDVKVTESQSQNADKVDKNSANLKGDGQKLATKFQDPAVGLAPAASPAPSAPAVVAAGKIPAPAVHSRDERFDEKPAKPVADAGPGVSGGFVPSVEKEQTAKGRPADEPRNARAAGAEPIAAQQKAAALPLPATPPESAAVGAELAADSLTEPTERQNTSAWAARMPSLPPDAENILRQALAHRERRLSIQTPQETLRDNQAAPRDGAPTGDDKSVSRAKSDAKLRQTEGKQESLSRSDGEAGVDQVQAVLVFRLMPVKASPAAAAPAGIRSPGAEKDAK